MQSLHHQFAQEDFNRALRKGFWRKIHARLTGKSVALLPYDDVRQHFSLRGQRYIGLQTVPLDHIVGSVGRYRDFDRAFTPTQTRTASRWMSIDVAHYQDIPLPPVELYKIGEVYFVKDGNHRVSVARERGQTEIDAYVIEIDIPVSLTPDIEPDKLQLKKEYAEFIEKTGILKLRPGANLEFTLPGEHERLLEHISAHRWYLGEKRGGEVSFSEAVESWYDNVYLPLVRVIREQGLLEKFPGRTETDLYLWVSEYQWFLQEAYHDNEPIKKAAEKFASQYRDAPTRKVIRQLKQARWVDHLILQQERANFFESTQLHETRPGAKIELTLPGKYEKLLEHIRVHRWYLGEERQEEVPFEEAAASWYDKVYLPIIEIIRQQEVLKYFPARTETDLYLWILEHRSRLAAELGWDIAPETVVTDLAARQERNVSRMLSKVGERIKDAVTPDPLEAGPHPGQWRHTRLRTRPSGIVFAELLVAIGTQEEDWRALEQAITIAQKNQARIHGLHVVPDPELREAETTRKLVSEFNQRCKNANVNGQIAIEIGGVARKISERAHWVDLIVLPINFPPAEQGVGRLASGFRIIVRRSGRPLMAIPGKLSGLTNILLAYNGSPKSDEGLYLAYRLLKEWDASLVVLTVQEAGRASISLNWARKFLEEHQVPATFVQAEGDVVENILRAAQDRHVDLLVMGGYGSNPLKEVMFGSTVDKVLRRFDYPVIIST